MPSYKVRLNVEQLEVRATPSCSCGENPPPTEEPGGCMGYLGGGHSRVYYQEVNENDPTRVVLVRPNMSSIEEAAAAHNPSINSANGHCRATYGGTAAGFGANDMPLDFAPPAPDFVTGPIKNSK